MYAIGFAIGFYIQFIDSGYFSQIKSSGEAIVLMVFALNSVFSWLNLRGMKLIQQKDIALQVIQQQRSRNLMMAIFFTEMTYIFNVMFRLGTHQYNVAPYLLIQLPIIWYIIKKFIPKK